MSIGTKFNLVALGIPVVVLLVLLGVIYFCSSNLFQPSLILVSGFFALDGVVWNRLRPQVEIKTHKVWDNYLKQIRDSVSVVGAGWGHYFPRNTNELNSKLEWVSNYGKYGRLKLYPP